MHIIFDMHDMHIKMICISCISYLHIKNDMLNMHIIFESVPKIIKIVRACRNYSLPKFTHFFETQCGFNCFAVSFRA